MTQKLLFKNMTEKLLALTIGSGTQEYTIQSPTGILSGGLDNLVTTITWATGILLTLATVAALFFLLYGGFLWMNSRGDAKKVEAAKQTIIYAIVGLFICLLSFFIAREIGYFLNVKIFYGQ